jgi:autoinducer 2-degrading protein
MIVRIIDIRVLEACVGDFKQASLRNREGSIREPGVLRFDLLQDDAQPGHFLLYEVYRDEQATQDHKQTEHYRLWRAAVEPMMAAPRGSASYTPVAPTDPGQW